MSKQEFINIVYPGAQEVQRQTGMFASVTIAQAIWETGGGLYTPVDIYTGEKSYNLFGRKAANGDPYVSCKTWEVVNGKRIEIIAKFKKFNSYEESVLDRCSFLTLPWYKKACNANTPEDAARFLIDTGYPGYSYATDPNYANGLISVIKSYNLKQYDLEDDDMAMNVPVWAWDELEKYVGDAYNSGIISDWSWVQKIKDKTLTTTEAILLKILIDARKENK